MFRLRLQLIKLNWLGDKFLHKVAQHGWYAVKRSYEVKRSYRERQNDVVCDSLRLTKTSIDVIGNKVFLSFFPLQKSQKCYSR